MVISILVDGYQDLDIKHKAAGSRQQESINLLIMDHGNSSDPLDLAISRWAPNGPLYFSISDKAFENEFVEINIFHYLFFFKFSISKRKMDSLTLLIG